MRQEAREDGTLSEEDVDLSAKEVTAAAAKRRAQAKPDLADEGVRSLSNLIAGRESDKSKLLLPKAAELLPKIHALVAKRNQILTKFSSGTYYYVDKNGKERRSGSLASRDEPEAQVSINRFYAERRKSWRLQPRS